MQDTGTPVVSIARGRLRRFGWMCAGLLWLAAIGAGMGRLWNHALTSGRTSAVAADWPAATRLTREPGRAALVMFAHPDCPCTRASLGELAIVMARAPGRLSAQVVFLRPHDPGPDWPAVGRARGAADMPGVRLIEDDDGLEARRFGALTSGHTLLYSADGRLVFSGGITGSRGHAGDNVGRGAVLAHLLGEAGAPARTPVFGCSLVTAEVRRGD
jgi:hypothetical protein